MIQELIKERKRLALVFGMFAALLTSCVNGESTETNHAEEKKAGGPVIILKAQDYTLEIDAAAAAVVISTAHGREELSAPQAAMAVGKLETTDSSAQWEYSGKGITVNMTARKNYVDVDIRSAKPTTFQWPVIRKNVVAYTIPWHQGKYVPASDPKWMEFWNATGRINGAQELSMQFFAANYPQFALTYIIKNMFNNELALGGKTSLSLSFEHEYPATMTHKEYGFRIYVTKNDAVSIAKTYQGYVMEEGKFLTLEEKAKSNSDIRKLYGAPFMYIWGNQFITEANITQWKNFMNQLAGGWANHIEQLIADKDTRVAFRQVIQESSKEDFVAKYTKQVVVNGINEALLSAGFYQKERWKDVETSPGLKNYIQKGTARLTQLELYDLNKQLFYQSFKDVLQPIAEWGNGTSSFMLDQLQEMGITKAWLGLESFKPAYMHPEFLSKAKEKGFLVGVYDSYHSIHEPGKEQWETAAFTDTTLYYTATIINKDGSRNKGFQGVGRKLNPALSMPAVKERVNGLFANGFAFNSWFIDCDATGEVFDDYTPGRMTSQAQDAAARLQRMSWIRDEKHLVIGSEGGNDFAAATIAYAHGIGSGLLPWHDKDWRTNKTSPYYFGPYFSPDGGVPVHFSKQVPVKPLYQYTYFDPRFSLPLFQLVYNNVEIPSHHWGMGTMKVKDEVINCKLEEILYNFPPLYNLDRKEITRLKKTIASHVAVFARTHSLAVTGEMTGFQYMTKDKMVQQTKFDAGLEITANFNNTVYSDQLGAIPAKSLRIVWKQDNKIEIYTPEP